MDRLDRYKVRYSMVFILMLCCVVTASDLNSSLSLLEDWDGKHGQHDLREASRIIREQALPGDGDVWQRLRGIVLRDDLPIAVRREALILACEKADKPIALEIIGLLTQWAVELEPGKFASDRWMADVVVGGRTSLIRTATVYGMTHLEAVAETDGPILKFLTIMATRPEFGVHTYALSAIAESRAPAEVRRVAALEVVTKTPRYAVALAPLVGVLEQESIPELRKLVRQSSGADQFHSHAAAILAHLGDEGILPDLERWQTIFAQKGKNLDDYAKSWIWKIQVQHPPEKLVAYIASDSPRLAREWAVRRAVELGVPKSEIRQAVLAHVAKLEATGKREVYGRMIMMKQVGLELGVLESEDLPDVKIPTELPTP